MEENLPKLIESDLTPEEQNVVDSFVQKGCPGLINIKEHNIFQWFSLYMADKSFSEIAEISKSDKTFILYMSQKLGWYEKKIGYYKDVQGKILNKVSNTKVKSLDFLSSFVECMNRSYGARINKSIMNNDLTFLDSISPKAMALYFKSLETLEKLSATPSTRNSDGGINVNVNLNSETQIKKVNDNTLTISPSRSYDEDLDEMLALQKEIEQES